MNRTIAPKIINAVDFDLQLKTCETYTLQNGINVYAINAGEQDVVQIEWVFAAGNSIEQKNIVAAATNHLLKNGTTTKTAFEINEHFDFYGSFISTGCSNETASINLHSLSKHLPKLLPVISEILSESIFPEDELKTFVQNSKQRLAVNLRKCDFVAHREIDALLYGKNHPYGKYSSMEDYDQIDRNSLVDFYNKFYKNGQCCIFVAGKLPADIFNQLNDCFGKLSVTAYLPKAVEKNVEIIQIKNRKTEILNDENGVQAAIRIAQNFPNRHHPDFQKVQVLNNIFGGYFGSRLMANIREDKGYTYGIHSYLQNHIEQSAWLITTEAGRDVSQATIKEVYAEMEILCKEPVDDEELLLVKNYMIGSILGDLDGPFQIIGRWKNYILNGTDSRYFYKAIETIKTIDAIELQALANKYLQPDLFYELVVI